MSERGLVRYFLIFQMTIEKGKSTFIRYRLSCLRVMLIQPDDKIFLFSPTVDTTKAK